MQEFLFWVSCNMPIPEKHAVSGRRGIWNVTAAQLSPDPVRSAVMECTDPDDSKRAAALKARMEERGDGVDDSAGTDDDISAAINQYLSTCDRRRRGSRLACSHRLPP